MRGHVPAGLVEAIYSRNYCSRKSLIGENKVTIFNNETLTTRKTVSDRVSLIWSRLCDLHNNDYDPDVNSILYKFYYHEIPSSIDNKLTYRAQKIKVYFIEYCTGVSYTIIHGVSKEDGNVDAVFRLCIGNNRNYQAKLIFLAINRNIIHEKDEIAWNIGYMVYQIVIASICDVIRLDGVEIQRERRYSNDMTEYDFQHMLPRIFDLKR